MSVDSGHEVLDANYLHDSLQPRQRLRSWLTEQLDSESCPGCGWLDRDVKVFKLTWKHYGRPGFDEERVSFVLLVQQIKCVTCI